MCFLACPSSGRQGSIFTDASWFCAERQERKHKGSKTQENPLRTQVKSACLLEVYGGENVQLRHDSKLDPCLFISDTVIAVMYVDDILMWSTHEDHIYALEELLYAEGVDLEEEDNAAGFLCVKLVKDLKTGQMIMTQEGLIDRVIEALHLDINNSKP